MLTSVSQVRRRWLWGTVSAVVVWAYVFPGAGALQWSSDSWQQIQTPVTTTVVPQSTTTTTTLPSAVTTLPDGCALARAATAVFVGEVVSVDAASAVFSVVVIRAGSLEGYQENGNVDVRYGSDVKYLDVGESYIVGVAPDPVSSRLSSTVQQSSELFGGAEIAGANRKCPVLEDATRTLTIDGRAINTGLFSQVFDQPWRIVLAFVLPPLIVLLALFAVVWFRRGVSR